MLHQGFWLTNEGLACKEADITFKEFENLLIEFSTIADYLSKIKFTEKSIEKGTSQTTS